MSGMEKTRGFTSETAMQLMLMSFLLHSIMMIDHATPQIEESEPKNYFTPSIHINWRYSKAEQRQLIWVRGSTIYSTEFKDAALLVIKKRWTKKKD